MLIGQLLHQIKTREGLLEQLGVDHAVLADKAFALFGVLRAGKEIVLLTGTHANGVAKQQAFQFK